MNEQLFSGQIVEMRNRLWRIDELDQHYVTALPLNGDACERKTFLRVVEQIKAAALEPLSPALTGNYGLQQLLLQAYRFSLVHGSAPFLSLQKSAATPYNYQLVPLTLALEKPTTRLLIADDVGLGKTIEAGLIMSELQQRGKIKKILILTPAALKEQWQESLQYFFHTESRIISSFTRK